METPTKLQNLQQDGIIIARASSRMTSIIFQKVFDPIPRNINKSTMVKKKYILRRKTA